MNKVFVLLCAMLSLIVLSLSLNCTGQKKWQGLEGENQCRSGNPELQKHKEWRQLFENQSKATANGCLRIFHGNEFTEPVLVRFGSDGKLYTSDGEEGDFVETPSFLIPEESKNAELLFSLLFFAGGVTDSEKTKLCFGQMSSRTFDCLKEESSCSFYLQFRPKTEGFQVKSKVIDGQEGVGCRAFFRSPVSVESETSPSEQITTPETTKTEETRPEVTGPEERASDAGHFETEPELAPEKHPEVVPESMPTRRGWARLAGTKGNEKIYAVALDKDGHIYVAGSLDSQSSRQMGTMTLPSGYGGKDIFVGKLSKEGRWLWAAIAGGPNDDEARGITVNDKGLLYITGSYIGEATFGVTKVKKPQGGGKREFFIAQMSTQNGWKWVKGYGGLTDDVGLKVKATSGGAFVAGYVGYGAYINGGFFRAGGYRTHSEIFIGKIKDNGSWDFLKAIGGTGVDLTSAMASHLRVGLATDSSAQYAYISGSFKGTFRFDAKALSAVDSKSYDLFAMKVTSKGTHQWSTVAGGTGLDCATAMAVGKTGYVYLTGFFDKKINFPSLSKNLTGQQVEAFVATIHPGGSWYSVNANKSSIQYARRGESIALDAKDVPYVLMTISIPQLSYSLVQKLSQPTDPYPYYAAGNIVPQKNTTYHNYLYELLLDKTRSNAIIAVGESDGSKPFTWSRYQGGKPQIGITSNPSVGGRLDMVILRASTTKP